MPGCLRASSSSAADSPPSARPRRCAPVTTTARSGSCAGSRSLPTTARRCPRSCARRGDPFRPDGWYAEQDVELLLGRRAARLDVARPAGQLEDGDELGYDDADHRHRRRAAAAADARRAAERARPAHARRRRRPARRARAGRAAGDRRRRLRRPGGRRHRARPRRRRDADRGRRGPARARARAAARRLVRRAAPQRGRARRARRVGRRSAARGRRRAGARARARRRADAGGRRRARRRRRRAGDALARRLAAGGRHGVAVDARRPHGRPARLRRRRRHRRPALGARGAARRRRRALDPRPAGAAAPPASFWSDQYGVRIHLVGEAAAPTSRSTARPEARDFTAVLRRHGASSAPCSSAARASFPAGAAGLRRRQPRAERTAA